jgi:hypothetical protein
METTITTSTDAPLDPREARAERRLLMLELLAEIGMALARDLSRRVGEGLEADEPLDGGAVALEFSRISRAVRQTIALEARLDQDREALAKMFADERAAREKAREDRIEGRRRTVKIAVQNAISRASENYSQALSLNKILCERLEDPREDDDFADLPVSTLVARICADLDLTPDWDLWKNTDWAADEWRAAEPGSPYAPMPQERPNSAAAVEQPQNENDAVRLPTSMHPPPRRPS